MVQQISLLPHPFFFVRLPPESVRRSSLFEGAHCRFKVATVLAGKLFDRLPLNHSSRTPALLSSVLPPPVATTLTFCLSFSFFLLSPSSPPFAMIARAPLPFRALLLVRRIDALTVLEKSRWIL